MEQQGDMIDRGPMGTVVGELMETFAGRKTGVEDEESVMKPLDLPPEKQTNTEPSGPEGSDHQ